MKRPIVPAAIAALLAACSANPRGLRPMGDGIDPRSIPTEYRADYELFAQRCSKCHGLARALENDRVDPRFWDRYVDRMRHQPGSGIAPEDVPPILHFLYFYSGATPAEGDAGK